MQSGGECTQEAEGFNKLAALPLSGGCINV